MERPADRFWSAVEKTDGCWIWRGTRRPQDDYGSFTVGRGDVRDLPSLNHTSGAHRVAWVLTHGPIPDGLCVCHRCDNPPCVNPAHLFLGTRADNVRDAARKGRMARKFSDAEVAEMRLLAARGIPQKNIAQMYGAHPGNVSNIVNSKARVLRVEDIGDGGLPPEAPPPPPPPTKRPRVPRLGW